MLQDMTLRVIKMTHTATNNDNVLKPNNGTLQKKLKF